MKLKSQQETNCKSRIYYELRVIHSLGRQVSYGLLRQSGFAALLTIVIIAAATLIMSYNASLLGLGELDLGYTSQKGNEAYAIADGCMEESLRQFRFNTSYVGKALITKNGSCIIELTTSGLNATSTVTASTTSKHYKKLETAFTFTSDTRPVITVISWMEKSD